MTPDQHLRRALEPFAACAPKYSAEDGGLPDGIAVCSGWLPAAYDLTAGDFRRAASALAETDITTDGQHRRAALGPPEGHATQSKSWTEIVERYGSLKRADLCGGDLTDLEAAFHVAMVARDQLDHEAVLCIARDRIRWLSVQLALSTHPPAQEGLREAIARVIDPVAFMPHGFTGDPDWHPDDDALERSRALAKADQILALIFPGTEGAER